MKRLRAIGGMCLALAAAAAIAGDLLSAEERWRFLQGGEPPDRYVRFLLDHPGSAHVAEARAYLEARDNAPLARLVQPDASCRALVQSRGQELLARAPARELAADYALVLPEGHFLDTPSYVEVPRGQSLATTPIERRITLNLVADRSGTCTLYERWGIGSGLGQACRCAPLDPNYRFRSRMADAVLTDVARMRAGDAACAAGQGGAIAAFLGDVVAAKRDRAARLKAHRDAGKTLYPTEVQELEDIEYALPFLEAGLSTPLKEEEERARLGTLDARQREGYCAGLAGRIEVARQQVASREPALP